MAFVGTVADRLRSLTADSAGPSLGRWFRQRRSEHFLETFPDLPSLRVIDLGGRAATWTTLRTRPKSVTLVNLEPETAADRADPDPREWVDTRDWIEAICADVCALPAAVTDRSWDLVFSNSVIEHVGGHHQRRRFAQAASDLAPRMWIQTPYRYFPVEPHWTFPAMQFLPDAARAAIAARWPLAWSRASGAEAVEQVLDVELLSVTALQFYFPQARIRFERVAGIPKSLIAVR